MIYGYPTIVNRLTFVNGGWEHLKVFKREEERPFNMIKTQDPNMMKITCAQNKSNMEWAGF
jgi:hypothetical protein